MKYTVLGFNQQMAVENELSVNDLLLLQYIMYANSEPTMSHIIDENEMVYVWLSHSKIHEDLPILGYSESTLKNKLNQLRTKEFIKSKTVSNTGGRGSRTYYSITEKTTYFLKYVNECSSTAKSTSYNTLNDTNVYNDLVISKDITKPSAAEDFEFGTKQHKPNLYEKCISLIHDFTNIPSIENLLVQYLDLCMEMKCIRGANQWKGMLNTLERVQAECSPHTYEELIQASIEHGWKTFYPIKDQKQFSSGKKFDDLIRKNNRDAYNEGQVMAKGEF